MLLHAILFINLNLIILKVRASHYMILWVYNPTEYLKKRDDTITPTVICAGWFKLNIEKKFHIKSNINPRSLIQSAFLMFQKSEKLKQKFGTFHINLLSICLIYHILTHLRMIKIGTVSYSNKWSVLLLSLNICTNVLFY